MNGAPTSPTSGDVQEWLRRGESQTVEFKATTPSIQLLAQIIASLANTPQGGAIVIGVRENPPQPPDVVGVSWTQISHVFEEAMAILKPTPKVMLHQVTMPDGKTVAVIAVQPSSSIVVSPAGAYVRQGTRTMPMTPAQVQVMVAPHGQVTDPFGLGEAMSELTETITTLGNNISYANSFRGKLWSYIIGFVLGVLASMVANRLSCAAVQHEQMKPQQPASVPVQPPATTNS